MEKEEQEGVHTCNQLFNHCDRSPAEKEGEPRKSKQKKNVNKGQNDRAGYQAKSRCRRKCAGLKTQHILGYRSGAGKDQQLNDQIKQAQMEKMISVTSVLYFNLSISFPRMSLPPEGLSVGYGTMMEEAKHTLLQDAQLEPVSIPHSIPIPFTFHLLIGAIFSVSTWGLVCSRLLLPFRIRS